MHIKTELFSTKKNQAGKLLIPLSFGKSIRDNSKWDKIIEGQQKTHAWNRVRLSLRGKSMIKTNPCFQAVIHSPNL